MKLQIGSGERTMWCKEDGWITLDPDPDANADYLASVPPIPPELAALEWQQIEAIHVIEHMFKWQAEEFLAESYAVLKHGGVLTLEAPDIIKAAEYLLGIREKSPLYDGRFYDMFAIYGDQRMGNEWYQHKWGWSPDTLAAACQRAGFEDVRVLPALYHWPWRDFRIEAYK